MHKLIAVFLLFVISTTQAATNQTHREMFISNDRVNVWETIIYPSVKQDLKMHRHDYDRVLVALDSGDLLIMNNKAQVHYLHLEKNKAYYLKKDVRGEYHTDQNISNHPISVIVTELK